MQISSHCHFHYACEFTTPYTRTNVKLLGPCFKTGKRKPFCPYPSYQVRYKRGSALQHYSPGPMSLDWGSHSAKLASKPRSMNYQCTDFLCFPFSNFRYSLTLFSKFFASFPHGTCTLSVSHEISSLRWNLPPT